MAETPGISSVSNDADRRSKHEKARLAPKSYDIFELCSCAAVRNGYVHTRYYESKVLQVLVLVVPSLYKMKSKYSTVVQVHVPCISTRVMYGRMNMGVQHAHRFLRSTIQGEPVSKTKTCHPTTSVYVYCPDHQSGLQLRVHILV
jgi:hypothetical protein